MKLKMLKGGLYEIVFDDGTTKEVFSKVQMINSYVYRTYWYFDGRRYPSLTSVLRQFKNVKWENYPGPLKILERI